MDARRRVQLAKMSERARKHPGLARDMGIKTSMEERPGAGVSEGDKGGRFGLRYNGGWKPHAR